MDFWTNSEAQKWCRENRIPLNDRGLPVWSKTVQQFEIPSDAGKRVALVARQMERFRSCAEILIWIDDWSVWESGERMHIFNRFRQSYGENRSLGEVPAHRIISAEFEDGVSIVTMAVLFLWDCYVLSKGNEHFCYYSHDEWGEES